MNCYMLQLRNKLASCSPFTITKFWSRAFIIFLFSGVQTPLPWLCPRGLTFHLCCMSCVYSISVNKVDFDTLSLWIYCKCPCQRPECFVYISTTEVPPQWLIKQEFNLAAASSRFTKAHHRIDLWLIIYCRCGLPAGGTRFDTISPTSGTFFALPRLVQCYSHSLNWSELC